MTDSILARTSVARVLDRAELIIDTSTPFLGLVAVAFTRPDWLGWLGATGWVLLVLDFYLSTHVSRATSVSQRVRRLAGPAVVLGGQAFAGSPGWVDWAMESAICGMGARSLALAWLMVRDMRRSGKASDYGVAVPGLVIIAAFSAATVLSFADAWRALHADPSDAAKLLFGLAAAWWADVGRLVKLPSPEPLVDDDAAAVWIGVLLFLWMAVAFGLRAWLT